MYIQSYQIHNVLNVYRRQLSQAKPDQAQPSGNHPTSSDSVMISAEGKNQSIMQKVADNVLKKITSVDSVLEKNNLSGKTILAFCGLGNHQQFFDTVLQLNPKKIISRKFSDHHKYTDEEMETLYREVESENIRIS